MEGTMDLLNRFLGSLLGLAVGDAVGTTVEFKSRGSFEPVTDMTGGGPFGLPPGAWTDDTSMALCLATSLLEKNGFDAEDQMGRYWRWYQEGYLSSTGRCFDIGTTTLNALENFHSLGNPFSGSTDPKSAGNGSIMRLAPVVMLYYPDLEAILHYSVKSSRTTHAALECLEACQLFGGILYRALQAENKRDVLVEKDLIHFNSESLKEIAFGDYFEKVESQILGTGYVVRSLEAALWSFWTTETYEEAILKAVNLGDDSDTTAAICGQVAGAFYGETGIPKHWLEKLVMREEIEDLAEKLFHWKEIK
ncbi:MAG: ADP-ribosylglycohydrolase family protein [Anaerolineaceae bacterium]|nr:ADP-ribosylglycohydrolase family protein [Anaerolineaceae bacterium]